MSCFSFLKRGRAAHSRSPIEHSDPPRASTCKTEFSAPVAHACCTFEPLPSYSAAGVSHSAMPASLRTEGLERALSALSGELRALSLDMHAHPEVMWAERRTHDLFVRFLSARAGWRVTPHAYGLETAFEAVFDTGRPGRTVGFQAELDALPGLGHACGHNLIAIAGLGAALALAHTTTSGRVVLLGTPAEEGGGGKLTLINNGAYKSMHSCVMVHPAPHSGTGAMLAVQVIHAAFKGHTAHAGAAPWQAINALDAAVLAYSNISALRQQMPPSHRVHGIIAGQNWAANVIPDNSTLTYNVRAPTIAQLNAFTPKVKACFDAAATATGCQVTITQEPAYADVRNSPLLASCYADFLHSRYGHDVQPLDFQASTDFGNVTYTLPALHAEYAIHLDDPATMGNHTAGFAAAAKTPEAHQRTLEAALALAVTGMRVITDDEFASQVTDEWTRWRKDAKGPGDK